MRTDLIHRTQKERKVYQDASDVDVFESVVATPVAAVFTILNSLIGEKMES